MKLSSRLVCGVLAAACFAAAQSQPASDSPPAAAANRPACPAGAAWFCVTQTLQRMMFNVNGTHKADAEIAAQVPRAITQMIKDGVMKPENAPKSPITGFDDADKFLNSYPSDVPAPAAAPVAEASIAPAASAPSTEAPAAPIVPAQATPSTDAPAKSEACPPDRPWLCTVPGAPPAPQSKTASRPKSEVPAGKAAAASKTPAAAAKDAEPAQADNAPLYVFGANDVVQVLIFGEKEASGTYTIMPDGRMSMPLIGSLVAVNLTVPELTEAIRKKLQDEAGILEPVVNVQLLRNNSKKFTIAGAVMRPGPVPLIQETTLFDALIAAGFQEFAKKNKIILRRGKKDFTFNFKDAMKGKGLDTNKVLQDGDYIIVAGE